MVQIVEQTYDEKVKMHSKLSKKELIVMLVEANKVIDTIRPMTYLSDNRTSSIGSSSTGYIKPDTYKTPIY